ncbi:hypothetical protein SAMN04488559_11321 [Isobaculum melis]|uniref:Uncharacterized protein n=1 Tax=Isobaculum melis TaxID=142588 RepID=A0A1H9TF23_9LACT|nr:hypothetical protein SAMN04488559_11321 [Isobaculum melis]
MDFVILFVGLMALGLFMYLIYILFWGDQI